jgi:TetR/AcrR family transcriptional repressor of nem operon
MVTLSTMVGALVLSRAVDDRHLSDDILRAAAEALLVPMRATQTSNGGDL